ncbi:MAG: ABC transporter ATP-binding protein [Pseudomonadota bacterium]
MAKTLECQNVAIHHEPGLPPTLSEICFSVDGGEKVALVGLNGTGKTTLLLSIVGLLHHQGEILICGEGLNRKNVAKLRQKIGFLFNVPEDQLLFPKVIEDVAFGLVRFGIDTEQAFDRTKKTLDKFGIGHLAQTPLHHLSHGQKQRVALAGAIVTNPPLLLLDEPTAGLDPLGKLELVELLLELESAQLIATHDLDFADRVCSRILLLEQGTIVEEEKNTDSIRKRWGLARNARYTKSLELFPCGSS